MDRKRNGFSLIELLIVVAVIGTLAAIAIVLLNGTQQQSRIARAQGDVRAIASAVSLYLTHTGALPPDLATLTSPATNSAGAQAGPFLTRLPSPPSGGSPAWSSYSYVNNGDGTWAVTASGDSTAVRAP
jgi:general secretion pathway protein G